MKTTMMVKYAPELDLIKNEPDFNRRSAIKRFFLLMDLEYSFLPIQQKLHSGKYSRTKAVTAYCALRKIPERTFYRWIGVYKEKGIKGLVPQYGSKSKKLYHRHQDKLVATLTIPIKDPLKCLETVQQIIERCTLIQPNIKHDSLALLKHYFKGLHAGSRLSLHTPLTDAEISALNRFKSGLHKCYSKKAAAILMANEGMTLRETMASTHASERTIYRWIRNFNKDRIESIKVHVHAPNREKAKAELQTRVIDIIHKMPSLYGINRTTWTYKAIAEAYKAEFGVALSEGKIQRIIHCTDYTWRHARKVLTSPDPNYKAKIERLLNTLHSLKEEERFFFIDEVGPYQVKKYGGRVLATSNQLPKIPEFQKIRGKIQFVAALEAVTNQMIWVFTPDKGAVSMTTLFDKIASEYADCSKVYFTWDSISVHSAKKVKAWIGAHNMTCKGPQVEVVPLPSKSQFLNVIESVFGGMKKAVICNSDYATPHDMQAAIARHFEERNNFYRENPKKAGDKIWDKQGFDFERLAGGLFKKM